MKLDKDSYYIKYWVNSNGSEHAGMTHYIDVWSNGYLEDTYLFDREGIYFEDASWNGIDPDDSHAGKRILKRFYVRWEKRVIDCKTEVERIARENASPLVKACSVGDCLYFPLKEIYAQLEEEEPEEELEEELEEETYDGPELCLFQITNADPVKLEGLGIHIDKNWVRVDSQPKPIPYLDFMEQALGISIDVYEQSKSIVSTVSSGIFEDIKQKCNK